jgi:hypothetical protein
MAAMLEYVTTSPSDTIPRIHQLVPHMRDQLAGMREGTTFEEARQRYMATVDELALTGLGRRTASRVGDEVAGWSTAKDALEEGMRLGWIERETLPSASRYVLKHRDHRYELTAAGQQAAEEAESDVAAFIRRLTDGVVAAHPYVRQLVLLLVEGPLVCPEINEGDLERARQDRRAIAWWAEEIARRLNNTQTQAAISAEDVAEEITSVLKKRFGTRPDPAPSKKALANAMGEAFSNAALRSRGLRLGGINFRSIKAWGSQLRILDESRYVPEHPQSNTIWAAADIEPDGPNLGIELRGMARSGDEVARELVRAYSDQAHQLRETELSSLDAPYIPIYKVRAQAAFRAGVTRALCDRILERLVEGDFLDLGVAVNLHLGGDVPPPSEPIYRREGTRRYEMTLKRKETPR